MTQLEGVTQSVDSRLSKVHCLLQVMNRSDVERKVCRMTILTRVNQKVDEKPFLLRVY